MKRALLSVSATMALFSLVACHRSPTDRPRDDRSRASVSPQPAAATLPEDAAAGQLALARWTEHLEEEERSRQANYDRRRLSEHRALIASLEQARASYDKAQTRTTVTRAQAQFRARLPSLQNSLLHIDRWGRSSHLVKDYRALLQLLENDYADARLAALEGNAEAVQRAGAELNARFAGMRDWLRLATTAEEE